MIQKKKKRGFFNCRLTEILNVLCIVLLMKPGDQREQREHRVSPTSGPCEQILESLLTPEILDPNLAFTLHCHDHMKREKKEIKIKLKGGGDEE